MFEAPETLVIIPIIAAIVQWIKKLPIFDNPKAKKWLPAISTLLGMAAVVLYSVIFQTGLDFATDEVVYTIIEVITAGLFYGLGASGCYSFVKCCLGNKEKDVQKYAKNFGSNACNCADLGSLDAWPSSERSERPGDAHNFRPVH